MQKLGSAIPFQLKVVLTDPLNYLKPILTGSTTSKYRFSNFSDFKRTIKIYTRTGDKGISGLFTGERRPKYDAVFDALGTIDELSCIIALALSHVDHESDKQVENFDIQSVCDQLRHIQCRLQALSSSVATPLSESVESQRPTRFAHVTFSPSVISDELEKWIDDFTVQLPPLHQFILPSGGMSGSSLHLARTVCRRAERCVVALDSTSGHSVVEESVIQYLNRLSDYLFTAARYVTSIRMFSGDEIGRGSGKGGGGGGSIREAGGSIGKRGATLEDEYFRRIEKEKIKEMKKIMESENHFDKEEIKRREQSIERRKKILQDLKD